MKICSLGERQEGQEAYLDALLNQNLQEGGYIKKIFTLSTNVAKHTFLMPLRKEKVEKYRKQLLARRERIAEDLRLMTTQLINDEVVYTDAVDQAAADTDKNFTLQMKNRDRNVLWQIDEAIKRLDDGSFGVCEHCGESISEGRIEAFPFTTLCIDCKSELESAEHRFPGRH